MICWKSTFTQALIRAETPLYIPGKSQGSAPLNYLFASTSHADALVAP
jgi:hypothetical protein